MRAAAEWLLVRLSSLLASVVIPDASDEDYDDYARGPQ